MSLLFRASLTQSLAVERHVSAPWRRTLRLRSMSSGTGPEVVELEVRGVVVGLFRENCWVVGSRQRGEACVIDPGDEPEEILALARDMGVRITRVVASHAHLDHIMVARDIIEATGASFLMHASDLFIADNLSEVARSWVGRELPPAPRSDAV